MTVIQIRGTSGSGKSWVMRQVMEKLGEWKPVYAPKRKRPLYYVHESGRVAVLGHYESPCGGCDSIGSARIVYELIESLKPKGFAAVLCEGLLLSEDVKWTGQLHDLTVLYLTTPVERCLDQVAQRRVSIGNLKPLNPNNTTRRVAVIERSRVKLIDCGVRCRRVSAEQATGAVVNCISEAQDLASSHKDTSGEIRRRPQIYL